MMKISPPILCLFICVIGVLVCPTRVVAQAAAGGGGGRLAFLSADDRAHLLKVRQQVLSSNADLKSEQESLAKERDFVKNKGTDATADDKKTLRENFLAHNEKMEAAMKTADPSVAPIIEQVHAKMKARLQERVGQGDGDGGSPNP